MANITITVQSLINASVYDSYTIDNGQTVNQLKTAINTARGFDSTWYDIVQNESVVSGTATLASLGIITGTRLRTHNKISRLATKELKQKAKLDLATLDRVAAGESRVTYDLTELPTQFSDNSIIDNPNTGGLVVGRPWISLFIGMDDPANAAESDATAWVLMDGPFYNTPGNPGSGFVGGQSWRKMAPAAPVNGKTSYVYGDESVNWTGSVWQYTNTSRGVISSSTDNVTYPWLATWTNGFTAAKITGTYVKTTNYPAVP
jgi:hypothetical protein